MSASITPAYAARRDPSNPWRWRCPDCSGPQMNRRSTQTDTDRYECDDCGWYGRVDELKDAREAADR
ncbi:hypothetical protein [Haloplanus rubicundus]|uniref:Uncharacterized protein n=1 Tax=Haloplanus rubicundus TaxID=1547898 RepID=A0A345EHI7_9EURY|nr:hypothetical protein [Haloplanus rubicundus]AXG11659.1 hypothetical protein DU484_18355 [Haloplanus rubicundus]